MLNLYPSGNLVDVGLSAHTLKYHSISSPSFYSALEWQFKFGYYMFGSSGTLALQGWLQGSWATLWQEDGNQTDAWHTADVEIPAAVSSLQFRTLSSSMEIAIDAFEQFGFYLQQLSVFNPGPLETKICTRGCQSMTCPST